MQKKEILIDENHRETTLHGSYEFPMAVYVDQLDKNALGFVNWHWHDEIQFSLVTKGDMEFCVNQKTYVLKAGQGIFINSGCLHRSKPVSTPDSTFICLDVAVKMLSFFQGSAIEQKYVKPYLKLEGFSAVTLDDQVEWQKIILTKIKEVYRLYTQKNYGYELDICILLAAVWRQLISKQDELKADTNANEPINQQRIKTIMSYIQTHYMEKMTLQEIAAIVHISKGECCRFFKRTVKCTVFDYIANCRINKSIELLRTTDLTVSEIAGFVGFGSTSYYIERFKRQVSCTPREYRVQHVNLPIVQ
ncbi:AraC family transcriptional regulator [Sporolactobacillus sp. KGMB 08714]|uniref:AraC family transcriptional regulator n=1 Tax=Sporolactobacillus sp. KGMB 08714 TaxID=3064704 RepID=UPI002FBE9FFC